MSKQDNTATFRSIAYGYLAVLVGAGVIYIATCAPAVLWQDSGLFVYRIWHNDIQGSLGLALAHPLYIMIGIIVKHIPIGDLAYRINLISAICAAITIANLFLFLRLWLNRVLPAIIGAVSLAVSWTFWQHAVVAEVYTLYTAQMFAELIVLLLYIRSKQIRYLYLLGLFNGLAFANHLWATIAFICYLVFIVTLLLKKQINLKHFGIIIVLWIVGASPYEYLIIKNIIQSGDFAGTLASALFGINWQNRVLNTSISMKVIVENIIFILLNFPTPNFLFFFLGLWTLRKTVPNRSFAYIILALLILYFVFAFRYTVPDRYVFFIPFYCIVAVLIGVGADVLLKRYNHGMLASTILVFALFPTLIYCITPEVGRKVYPSLAQRRQRPYRDEYVYFLQPWKAGYKGAARFAEDVLSAVEKNAIIWADATTVHVLLYEQEVKGRRSDVKIVSGYYRSENAPAFNEDTIERLMEDSSIYVVSPLEGYCPEFLLEQYSFVSEGILWRVVEKQTK